MHLAELNTAGEIINVLKKEQKKYSHWNTQGQSDGDANVSKRHRIGEAQYTCSVAQWEGGVCTHDPQVVDG